MDPTGCPYSGLDIPDYEIPQAVRDVYPDLGHAPNWDEAIELTKFVSDDVNTQLCDAMGLIGTPEHCTQRITEMAQHGVTQLYLMPCLTFAPPPGRSGRLRSARHPGPGRRRRGGMIIDSSLNKYGRGGIAMAEIT